MHTRVPKAHPGPHVGCQAKCKHVKRALNTLLGQVVTAPESLSADLEARDERETDSMTKFCFSKATGASARAATAVRGAVHRRPTDNTSRLTDAQCEVFFGTAIRKVLSKNTAKQYLPVISLVTQRYVHHALTMVLYMSN